LVSKKDENDIVLLEAILEISGILIENTNNNISKRYSVKKKQVEASPYKTIIKNIIIVEFSTPKLKVKLL